MTLFSIVTICRNAQDTLERTIESIDCQSFTDYEHIIIDGASTDGTLNIIRNHPSERRCVISEPDKGLYDAMNKGLARASGKYVIFLNAGDKFHEADTLNKVAGTIFREDFPGIVYGQTDIVDNEGCYLRPRHLSAPENLTLKSFANGMVVCHQAFIALRKITSAYDTRYRFSADFDWCIRCLQHSRKNVGMTDTVLIDYLSEGVTTANHRASLIERFKIMTYYYGFFPTLWRHFGFIIRNACRRK